MAPVRQGQVRQGHRWPRVQFTRKGQSVPGIADIANSDLNRSDPATPPSGLLQGTWSPGENSNY